ncbi:ATP-binding cassette subfamily C protein [Novosphingobium sp. PhB165]|uniref:type I secretion system permease/ATPase n=1 Tax=Novosphingobium sp. PhB165 TaxID=2485105 RepID=UPI001049F6AC|nr:type I secretion system permease/ATPase [Novosphingobium sp. PhB165]TCM17980.1 ATP-binding cassette subfamily C protein [Novosphingobium sp. PhB165]
MSVFPDSAAARPIRQAIGRCRRHFLNAGLFSAFLNVLYLAPSVYMLQVYDRVVPTRGVPTLIGLTLIFIVAILSVGLLDLVRNRLLLRAGARLDQLLAGPIMEALLEMSATRVGQVNAATLREFDLLRQTITGVGVLALFDAPWAPIYIFVCFLIHPAIGALCIGGAVVLSLLSWLSERSSSRAMKEAIRREQYAYSSLELSLGAAGVIGALGMREAMVRRHLRERLDATGMVNRAGLKATRYNSAIKAARLLLQSLALGLGALLAIEQQISGGAIFASSLLIARALQPIELINGAWKNLLQAGAAYAHIVELFSLRGESPAVTALPSPRGAIAVENLGVAAPSRDRLLVGGVGFALEPGELLGVIGPSGAGKSTLAKALVGILEPAQGTVRLDGSDLRNWPPQQLGQAIGYVPQEPVLFRGTIKENIARFETENAAEGTLDEKVVQAAQLCGAHDFIVRLPQGYDTELGWAGGGLSMGQAQRIALARALYGDPVVVVLDEPNASLDAEGEMRLGAALDSLRRKGVTLVVIAHRAGILQTADKLLVLRGGRVEMFGERSEVVARLNAPKMPTGDGDNAPPPPADTTRPIAAPPAPASADESTEAGQTRTVEPEGIGHG